MSHNHNNSSSQHWNGRNYQRISSPQYSINMNFLRGVVFNGDESILDIGCGNGGTSRELARLVPNGHVLGIDASQSMIAQAQEDMSAGNIDFELLNAQDIYFEEKFNIASSFFCMQWVHDKSLAFCKINRALKPMGRFLMITPLPHPHLPAIRGRLINQPQWAQYFQSYQDPLIFINDNNYSGYVSHAGMALDWEIVEHHPVYFSGYEHFFDFMYEMTPHLNQLPEQALKTKFMNELISEYLHLYPINSAGYCVLDFNLHKMICSRV